MVYQGQEITRSTSYPSLDIKLGCRLFWRSHVFLIIHLGLSTMQAILRWSENTSHQNCTLRKCTFLSIPYNIFQLPFPTMLALHVSITPTRWMKQVEEFEEDNPVHSQIAQSLFPRKHLHLETTLQYIVTQTTTGHQPSPQLGRKKPSRIICLTSVVLSLFSPETRATFQKKRRH